MLPPPKYYTCRTNLLFLAVATFFPIEASLYSQSERIVLRSNTRNIQIVDGNSPSKGDWVLDPSIELDIYDAIRSDKPKSIVFKSDVVLSRFNTILDFPANEAYFKPNAQFASPFRVRGNGPPLVWTFAIAGGAALVVILLWYWSRAVRSAGRKP